MSDSDVVPVELRERLTVAEAVLLAERNGVGVARVELPVAVSEPVMLRVFVSVWFVRLGRGDGVFDSMLTVRDVVDVSVLDEVAVREPGVRVAVELFELDRVTFCVAESDTRSVGDCDWLTVGVVERLPVCVRESVACDDGDDVRLRVIFTLALGDLTFVADFVWEAAADGVSESTMLRVGVGGGVTVSVSDQDGVAVALCQNVSESVKVGDGVGGGVMVSVTVSDELSVALRGAVPSERDEESVWLSEIVCDRNGPVTLALAVGTDETESDMDRASVMDRAVTETLFVTLSVAVCISVPDGVSDCILVTVWDADRDGVTDNVNVNVLVAVSDEVPSSVTDSVTVSDIVRVGLSLHVIVSESVTVFEMFIDLVGVDIFVSLCVSSEVSVAVVEFVSTSDSDLVTVRNFV